MCTKFIQDENNDKEVKRNTHLYQKERNKKAQNAKIGYKMNNFIRHMSDKDGGNTDISPIINLAQAMINDDMSEQSSGSITDDHFDSE